MRRGLAVVAVLLAAAACGPSLQAIQRYVATSARRRIAVLPFIPAPKSPKSGTEAAAIISASLKDLGFLHSEAAEVQKALATLKLKPGAPMTAEDAKRAGQLLGVAAVLTGSVNAAAEESQKRPAVYQEQYKPTKDSRGHITQVASKVLVSKEATAKVRTYSVEASLVDAENGTVLWQGAGQDQREDESVLQLAQDVLAGLARDLGQGYLKKKL